MVKCTHLYVIAVTTQYYIILKHVIVFLYRYISRALQEHVPRWSAECTRTVRPDERSCCQDSPEVACGWHSTWNGTRPPGIPVGVYPPWLSAVRFSLHCLEELYEEGLYLGCLDSGP